MIAQVEKTKPGTDNTTPVGGNGPSIAVPPETVGRSTPRPIRRARRRVRATLAVRPFWPCSPWTL